MRLMSFLAAGFLALAAPAFATAPMGDDGLHKPEWLQDTFKDMTEDLEAATAEGKRLLVIWEQRGCIYCKKMETEEPTTFCNSVVSVVMRESNSPVRVVSK